MDIELRHFRYFLAVAEERNFTRAAKRVGIGQPPLSEQIRDLEARIGVPLFVRHARGAELTDAGRALVPEAETVLRLAARAETVAQRGARGELGRLRIGFTSSAAFHPRTPAAIRAFRRAYPDVELVLDEASTIHLIEKMNGDLLDAAFVRPGRHDPFDLETHAFDDEAMVVALPSQHRLAKRRSIALRELARERFVLFPRNAGSGLYDEIIGACGRAGFEPIVSQEAPQLTSVANFVAADLGVAFVPQSVARVRVAGVSYVSLGRTGPVARLALVTRRGASVVLQNFVRVATD